MNLANKPFSEACERNKSPILEAIRPLLTQTQSVLEIGSGTGQHAVHFASQLPHLTWYASDQVHYHAGLQLWLTEAHLPNLKGPLTLNVSQAQWPDLAVDAVFSANTLHIMGWAEAAALLQGVAQLLPSGGQLLVYGPFNHKGQYTSPGNANLDQWVKENFPAGGIKDLAEIQDLASQKGFDWVQTTPMPANNQLLHWVRRA